MLAERITKMMNDRIGVQRMSAAAISRIQSYTVKGSADGLLRSIGLGEHAPAEVIETQPCSVQ
jgi:hypothetical protein